VPKCYSAQVIDGSQVKSLGDSMQATGQRESSERQFGCGCACSRLSCANAEPSPRKSGCYREPY
jgi:hypothetical protein